MLFIILLSYVFFILSGVASAKLDENNPEIYSNFIGHKMKSLSGMTRFGPMVDYFYRIKYRHHWDEIQNKPLFVSTTILGWIVNIGGIFFMFEYLVNVYDHFA